MLEVTNIHFLRNFFVLSDYNSRDNHHQIFLIFNWSHTNSYASLHYVKNSEILIKCIFLTRDIYIIINFGTF